MVYSLVKAKDKKLLKSKYAVQARVLRLSPWVKFCPFLFNCGNSFRESAGKPVSFLLERDASTTIPRSWGYKTTTTTEVGPSGG